MSAARHAAVVLLAAAGPLLTAACGSSAPSYSLIHATSAACGAGGRQLAAYLATGQPPSMDAQFGGDRESILALPAGQQQSVAIDQEADQLISGCDQQVAAAAAQMAAAAAAQAAERRQQAARQAYQDTESAACAVLSGRRYQQGGSGAGWDGLWCNIDYLDIYAGLSTAQLSVSGSGAIEPDTLDPTVPRSRCHSPGQWSGIARLCVVKAG